MALPLKDDPGSGCQGPARSEAVAKSNAGQWADLRTDQVKQPVLWPFKPQGAPTDEPSLEPSQAPPGS